MNWKERTKIINAFEQKGSRIFRFLKPEGIDVAEALLTYFRQ